MPADLSGIDAGFPRTVSETLRREVGWGETVSFGELAGMAGRPPRTRTRVDNRPASRAAVGDGTVGDR